MTINKSTFARVNRKTGEATFALYQGGQLAFTITKHARERMMQRSVTAEEISTTLRNFDLTYPGDNDGLTVLKLFPDGRMLKVWIAESSLDQNPLTIKSVAWEGRE